MPGRETMHQRSSRTQNLGNWQQSTGNTTRGAENTRRLTTTSVVAETISKSLPPHATPPGGCRHVNQDIFLEGGALEVNRNGVLLCTRNCVLNSNRNPNLSESNATEILKSSLGVQHVIWLDGDGITGDDTDGHIDQLARFTPSEMVLYAWVDDESDPQRPALEHNLNELKTGLERFDLGVHPVPLPLPSPVFFDGQRLPASYCNFYITNRSVIVPQFDDPADAQAIDIIAMQFPEHQTVGLPSKNISVGLGSFHCLTQQQPSV